MATVLVTGGAGFIGSHTVDRLLTAGHSVRIIDALCAPVHPGGEVPAYVPAEAELIVADVRERAAWERALVGVDAVFHLAAYQDYQADFSRYFDVNVTSTALLYEVALERRLPLQRVVIASSQAVYGEGCYRCPACAGAPLVHPRPRSMAAMGRAQWEISCAGCGGSLEPVWTDESQVDPHNCYALSKYGAERAALVLGERYGIPTVGLRYSITQGSRQSFHNAYSGILRNASQRLLAGSAPICYEDGRQRRDYVSVHDVVDANLLALSDERAVGRQFNVGGGRTVTARDYAQQVIDAFGADLEPEISGLYRVGDTRHLISDVSSLGDLGWRPTRSLQAIVEEYVEWITAQPGVVDGTAQAHQQMLATGTLRRSERMRPAPGAWTASGTTTKEEAAS
jgi:dTDP-L-rhamnose 4-epimerase